MALWQGILVQGSEVKTLTKLSSENHLRFQLEFNTLKMAASLITKALKSIKNPNPINSFTTFRTRHLSSVATVHQPQQSDDPSSSFTFSTPSNESNDDIYIKGRKQEKASSSVTMPMSFMTGSIVGKRFYKKVSTREADDGNGWTVMLDYRTLKTPSKRPLKLPTLGLAKAIGAEWEYQVCLCFRLFIFPFIFVLCTLVGYFVVCAGIKCSCLSFVLTQMGFFESQYFLSYCLTKYIIFVP